jgi:hypothetical protein
VKVKRGTTLGSLNTRAYIEMSRGNGMEGHGIGWYLVEWSGSRVKGWSLWELMESITLVTRRVAW